MRNSDAADIPHTGFGDCGCPDCWPADPIGCSDATSVLHPRNQVGMEIRTLHGFRRGSWALISAWVEDAAEGPCWLVEFPDGVTDWWRCDDPDGQYEIRGAA